MMLMDRIIWQAGENFIRTDKIFMSQSIEIRSPFAYYPVREKYDAMLQDPDYTSENLNKYFLRQMYKDKLPKYIVERERKWGWKSPFAEWYDETSKQFILQLFEGLQDSEMIKWSEIRRHIQSSTKWPGKEFFSYISLAILSKKFKIEF